MPIEFPPVPPERGKHLERLIERCQVAARKAYKTSKNRDKEAADLKDAADKLDAKVSGLEALTDIEARLKKLENQGATGAVPPAPKKPQTGT